ncbi:MAG TPA: LysR family transcriptional regulator [Sulfurihydrogenibium sp.]|uniref:LysR substrate-binding domain-containing protein n=1 Tax=Sulfurihydrogenibium sp. (strain YO3AOP1) TaxID=436114 RepID=UPI000172492D|nr:LysR family transcriptional regulator [Sulfurihydrogenibium sp. YO3AOP1]ACD66119.1 transcriptional regulator, LysR family [Sulfurihydrogenibium sp. YO3AOP1]HBT98425.1 LysR family transcriptional regulator [Sulfurihydrogenibium sp.]
MEVLDYHKLRIFKAVADLKSFSKAAQMLFLSQPTVTLQIKKIENYLGMTLFRRHKSNLELTEEGKVLYQFASKIIEDYMNMEENLKNVRKTSILYIGCSSTIGDYLLPKIITKFISENPEVSIKIFIGNSKEVEDGVLSKIFNIGLVEDNIISNKLDISEFYEDEIILIASKNNSISEYLKTQNELKNYKFIFREFGSGTRNIVEQSLKIKISPSMEVSSSKAIAKIVQNSDYLAFVSKLVAEDLINDGHLKKIEVDDLKITRKFSIITQKNIRLSSVENKFYRFLKNFT